MQRCLPSAESASNRSSRGNGSNPAEPWKSAFTSQDCDLPATATGSNCHSSAGFGAVIRRVPDGPRAPGLACILACSLLGFLFLNGANVHWLLATEPLLKTLLNELRKRHFPGLLPVVRDATELLGIHPQFASHLNLGMRQVITLAGFDPRLELVGNESSFCHDQHLLQDTSSPSFRRRTNAQFAANWERRPQDPICCVSPASIQTSTRCRSPLNGTRQLLPSESMEAVRWLMRMIVPTCVCR